MKTTLALLLICTTLFAFGSEYAFDRTSYGSSRYGIWSKLMGFEDDALAVSKYAQQGNAKALLALAIVASGDVRTRDRFESYNHTIERFFRTYRSEFDSAPTVKQKAARIFEKMNEFFFDLSPNSDRMSNYDLDQSALTAVFKTKKFNCISSSILYSILLRYEDIPVSGVLLPGHSFVQIDINPPVEVETTSKQGFGYPHTKETIARTAQAWASRRGVEAYDWNDYLNRDIITPYELILHNFVNQHTGSDRMSYQNRLRIVEIRSLLAPTDISAMSDRLSYYNNEAEYLRQYGRKEQLQKFFKTITPFMNDAARYMTEYDRQKTLTALKLSRLNALAPLNYETYHEEFLTLLRQFPGAMKRDNVIQNNTIYTASQFQTYFESRNEQQRAIALFKQIESTFGKQFDQLKNLYVSLYQKSAIVHWDKGEWEAASKYLKNALAYATPENRAQLLDNLDASYFNMAAELANSKRYREADEVLSELLRIHPKGQKCKSLKKKIKPYL